MWIFLTGGYFSIVQSSPTEVMVRARARADIERLREDLMDDERVRTDVPIIETPRADYPFRIIVSRAIFADYMAAAVRKIDYTNFKNEVAKTDPDRSHGAYLGVWSVLREGIDDRRRPRDMIDRSIDELDLSLRVLNSLTAHGVRTVRDLTQYSRADVTNACGLVRCANEVEKELARHGLKLRGDPGAVSVTADQRGPKLQSKAGDRARR